MEAGGQLKCQPIWCTNGRHGFNFLLLFKAGMYSFIRNVVSSPGDELFLRVMHSIHTIQYTVYNSVYTVQYCTVKYELITLGNHVLYRREFIEAIISLQNSFHHNILYCRYYVQCTEERKPTATKLVKYDDMKITSHD